MIVKGSAGTGKTTFALQLTEEIGGIGTSFYMSTRVSDESLYNQFPWLRERMKQAAAEIAGRQYTKTLGEQAVHTEGGTEISFEVRIHGELRYVRVTPRHGRAYYLIPDTNGATFIRRDSLDSTLKVPMWVLFSF